MIHEIPILFTAPMVRALLAGTKTQTRRIVKGLPAAITAWQGPWQAHGGGYPDGTDWCFGSGEIKGDPLNFYVDKRMPCPYGLPGHRLWVRETHRFGKGYDGVAPRHLEAGKDIVRIHYEADGAAPAGMGQTRVSIHMTRWASRIDLEVTGVRVERLQAISEADAKAEGCQPASEHDAPRITGDEGPGYFHPKSYAEGYRLLWESINGAGSWDLNQWVWVIEFKRVRP